MSSHHFVKEGQEPALFIVEAFSFNTIAPLLEWAPLVMVTDSALDVVLSWGIKIDIILTQANQVEVSKAKALTQMPLQIIVYEKNQDPVSLGLTVLTTNQKAVHLVDYTSDDVFTRAQSFLDQINIVLLDQEIRWIPITTRFQKWLPSKTNLKVRRSENQRINQTGLTEIGNDVFETNTDGNITLESPEIFWIGETIS